MSEYDKIVSKIKAAPKTFLPALLTILVKTAYAKNVFQPGGASRIIQKVEASLPPNKVDAMNAYESKKCSEGDSCDECDDIKSCLYDGHQ
jgi:hypothetical protein